jgi:hypothetical protein
MLLNQSSREVKKKPDILVITISPANKAFPYWELIFLLELSPASVEAES